MEGVSAVVVTLNALPWLERCLESIRGLETVVVDHGSTDGTLELVERRFPGVTVLRRENRGYGAGLNAGIEATSGRYVLLLNSDAWAMPGAVDRLVAFAEAHPRAAAVGPRSRFPDGRVQHTVRGFPTLWRLASEYFFLRKLAPRSELLNSFYAAGFRHDRPRPAEWVMGYALLVRREAIEEAGVFDEGFFMFSEETDLCRRFWDAGWEVWFTPDAEFTHVGGANNKGLMFDENVRGHIRYLAKHHGEGYARWARRLLFAALVLRGVLFRGERGRRYRDAARQLRA